MSARKTVVRTTLANVAPAASRIASRFWHTRRVCAAMSPCTIRPVAGSIGTWPDTKSSDPRESPESTARWPSAPTRSKPPAALGDLDRLRRRTCLDDLVGPDAARADPEALDASVHNRANALQVRFEPAGGHVVSVADITPDNRALSADFTAFRHQCT